LHREARALTLSLAEARASKDRNAARADTLREALDSLQPTDTGLIEAYQGAIEDAQNKKANYLLQIAPLRQEINEKLEEFRALTAALKDRENDVRKVAQDLDDAKVRSRSWGY